MGELSVVLNLCSAVAGTNLPPPPLLQSTLADYTEMPVELFGAAVLRGMGWKKGEAIGKSNKG